MNALQQAFEELINRYGPQGWWPGEGKFEIMVGAILTQNTSWKNVEKAIDNLRSQCLLTVEAIHALSTDELAETIRPAGYYNLKATRLKNLVVCIISEYDGDVEKFCQQSKTTLREQLLEINGIGPETADSIVLYAAEKPIFVIDNYTARVVKRHGWIEYEADYYMMQEHFHSSLPEDVPMFNEFHALIVRVGKDYCSKTPNCEDCPLADMLPSSGPLQE